MFIPNRRNQYGDIGADFCRNFALYLCVDSIKGIFISLFD